MEYASIEKLVKELRENSHDETVSMTIEINCEGFCVKSRVRTPEDLKKSGISMRNLKGNFIRSGS